MKRLAVLFALFAATRLWAANLAETYAPLGRLIITNFATAPFPHPLRAEGHKYHDQLFSAADHYEDSQVALFVPKDFRPGRAIDFVVHFHGWGANISNALGKYRLPEQFAASRRNAILIVPQGPLNASDSFGGKLEDDGGFKRFMDEAMDVLEQNGVVKRGRTVGRIILSGHSGGYEVMSAILARGGLTDKVNEVWLFDALYAKTERFSIWFDHHSGRFIDLYTEHGGTKEESEALMTALKGNGVPCFSRNETNTSQDDLRNNHLLFLFSELPHDQVMQQRDTFQRFLETSCLEATGAKSVRNVYTPDGDEDKALAARARKIGDDVYPQVVALLAGGHYRPPRRFDIVFRKSLPTMAGGEEAWGYACRKTAYLNASLFHDHPEYLDSVLVHEMGHVVQDYPRMACRHIWQWWPRYLSFKLGHPFRAYPRSPPTYWAEGIADYVCAELGHTNFSDCPQCNERFPRYTSGYSCAAAFLLYIDAAHGRSFTRNLNARMRQGAYSDHFFVEATGKTLNQLWTDFQSTSAFTPIAAEYNELDETLGYTQGKPPRDLETRLENYFMVHPDAQRYVATLNPQRDAPPESVADAIKQFIYIREQPGGEELVEHPGTSLNDLRQSGNGRQAKRPNVFERAWRRIRGRAEIAKP